MRGKVGQSREPASSPRLEPPRTPRRTAALPPAARHGAPTRLLFASPQQCFCKEANPQGGGEEILRHLPAPRKLQLGGAPTAAPPPFVRQHQRGVPTRGGWGKGEAGPGPRPLPAAALALPGSGRGQPGGSLASGPYLPSRRTCKSKAARG